MKLLSKTCAFAAIIGLQLSCGFGQSVYFKAGGAFHLPINKQESPDLFSLMYYRPSSSGYGSGEINQKNYNFSLAEGVSFNGAIGRSLNNYISVELGVSYFANTKKEFDADQQDLYSANATTTWRFNNYSLHPTLIVGQTMNKSTINISLNLGIGFSNLKAKAASYDLFNEYTFSKSFSYGYGYGIEYLYQLSPTLQWYIQGGINNTYYSPTHAELTSSSYTIANLQVYQREIDYVKEIKGLQVPYSNSLNPIYTDINKPEVRLRETVKLNSVFVGIGIKYTLSKP